MFSFPPTIILRHRKENLNKCSLKGLEERSDFLFFTYPGSELPDLSGYVLLTLDAPPLSKVDAESGLFLIDGTWRYASLMYRQLPKPNGLIYRSLPSELKTAYPRRQLDCPDPERGLASIEALFAAYAILGRDTSSLLQNYHWKEQFLEMNHLKDK
jgi:pre-rRNA-processing protein TSR3